MNEGCLMTRSPIKANWIKEDQPPDTYNFAIKTKKNYLPLFKSFIQQCVVCTHNKNNIKPTFWEEITAVIVHHISTTRGHLLF